MTEAHLKLIKLGFIHEAVAYVTNNNLLREFLSNTTAWRKMPAHLALLDNHGYGEVIGTDIINQAFSWDTTKEGLNFWYHVSSNFNLHCAMKNIAKQDKLTAMNVTLFYGPTEDKYYYR